MRVGKHDIFPRMLEPTPRGRLARGSLTAWIALLLTAMRPAEYNHNTKKIV